MVIGGAYAVSDPDGTVPCLDRIQWSHRLPHGTIVLLIEHDSEPPPFAHFRKFLTPDARWVWIDSRDLQKVVEPGDDV